MRRFVTRDPARRGHGADGAAAAAIPLPFRASRSNTNEALLLTVLVVGVAAIGNRVAGSPAGVSAAV